MNIAKDTRDHFEQIIQPDYEGEYKGIVNIEGLNSLIKVLNAFISGKINIDNNIAQRVILVNGTERLNLAVIENLNNKYNDMLDTDDLKQMEEK